MRHLYVAATLMELRGVFDHLPELNPGEIYVHGLDAFLVCGVGLVQSLLGTTSALFELAPMAMVNVGICGAYQGSGFNIGDVLWVSHESLADFGVSDGADFLGPKQLGWSTPFEWNLLSPFDLGTWAQNELAGLANIKGPAKGATVQCCTGSEAEARLRFASGAQIETMEGAALAAIAQKCNIPFVQIRSVSNCAGPRNFESWNIPFALKGLREVFNVKN